MAEKPPSPRPNDSTQFKSKPSAIGSNILIDSDHTPKSLAGRFQSPGTTPVNPRKTTRPIRGKSNATHDDTPCSTDDEYFAQPNDPRQHKKSNRGRKKTIDGSLDKQGKALSVTASKDLALPSGSNDSAASVANIQKGKDIDTYNIISDLLNAQTERLERQIDEGTQTVLITMESKMDSIIQESERRMHDRITTIEDQTNAKLDDLSARLARVESQDPSTEAYETRINTFTSVMNKQLDQIANRIDTNLSLIKENAARIASIDVTTKTCPNEKRMTKVEGGLGNVGQEHRNFSLIITGLHPEFQNANGVIGFAREVLGVYIDPFELSEVMRLGVTKKGLTITKVILFSVGSRIHVYQARVAMRGNSKGILSMRI